MQDLKKKTKINLKIALNKQLKKLCHYRSSLRVFIDKKTSIIIIQIEYKLSALITRYKSNVQKILLH